MEKQQVPMDSSFARTQKDWQVLHALLQVIDQLLATLWYSACTKGY